MSHPNPHPQAMTDDPSTWPAIEDWPPNWYQVLSNEVMHGGSATDSWKAPDGWPWDWAAHVADEAYTIASGGQNLGLTWPKPPPWPPNWDKLLLDALAKLVSGLGPITP